MPVATKKRMSRPERELRMLDAAAEVFSAHEFNDSSMDDIAERSGITKALLYQYFGSKKALYDATVERGRAELFDRLSKAVAAAPPGRARTVAFVEEYFDDIAAKRGHWWLLYGQASSSSVNEMRNRNAEALAAMLERTIEDPRPSGAGSRARKPDPQAMAVLAHSLVGAGEQVGRWWAGEPRVPKKAVVERFLAVILPAIDAVLDPQPKSRKGTGS